MAKAKGNCPRCGMRMDLTDRYCSQCRNANPMLAPRVIGKRARPAPAPGRAAPLAPVIPIDVARDSGLGRELYDPDPHRRQVMWDIAVKNVQPQYAAVHDLAARTARAWDLITAECDPGRRDDLYRTFFGYPEGGGAA
jgi:hypothetical protein